MELPAKGGSFSAAVFKMSLVPGFQDLVLCAFAGLVAFLPLGAESFEIPVVLVAIFQ